MFGKLMSAIGLDNVKVDTVIHTSTLYPGQAIQGQIIATGGNESKTINGVSLKLMTIAEVESGDHEFNQPLVLARWDFKQTIALAPQERLSFDFDTVLPLETPITQVDCYANKTRVWIETELDVTLNKDASDRDYLRVHPTPAMQAFLNAMDQIGFRLKSVDVEKGHLRARNFQSTIGCYQELEFVAKQMFSRFNEVEVSFVPQEQQTHVMLEIDLKHRGDQLKTLTIQHQQLDTQRLVQDIRLALGL